MSIVLFMCLSRYSDRKLAFEPGGILSDEQGCWLNYNFLIIRSFRDLIIIKVSIRLNYHKLIH